MWKRLFIQTLCILMTLFSWSQTSFQFDGKVYSKSAEPLVGAQFINPETGKIVALSDESGVYSFMFDLDSVLVFQIGYVEKLITSGTKKVILEEESSLLGAIVVTENRSESTLKNSTISLDIIKPELIQNTSPTNIEESIGRISGVQVVDNQPTIRSGGGWSYGAGSRVQVLVDGVPMLSGDAGQPLWTFMPTEGIESVEIIKGASSVLYGSSALNGVINIKTRDASKSPYSKFTRSAGHYDFAKRESLQFNGKTKNSVINTTAYHSGEYKGIGITGGLNILQDQGYKMGDYDNRVRGTLGLKKVSSKNNLVYGVNTSYQKGESGSFLLWESLDLGYTALDSNTTDNQVSRLSIDPYVKWNTGKFTHSWNSRYLSIENKVDNGDSTIDQSNSSDLWYTELRSRYSLPKRRLEVTGGLVGISSTTESPLFSGNQQAENLSGYVQIQKGWGRLTASGGARYEHFRLNDINDGKPVFRSGVNYKLAKYTFLRSSYGQGYRFPSIAESYVSTTVGPISIFPNSDLEAETGSNAEIGVRQGFRIKGIQMMLDVSVFQMEFENMMEFTFGQWGPIEPPLFGAGFKTVNTGKARIRGTEFTLSFQRKKKDYSLQGFVGYTYTSSMSLDPNGEIAIDGTGKPLTYNNTSSDTTGFNLKYRPNHLVKGDVIFRYSKFTLGLGVSYSSQVKNIDKAFVTFPFSFFVPGVQESIDQGLSSRLLINSRLGYKISDFWSVNMILSNITNKEYSIRPADLGAPRTVRLQIAYTIDKSK